MYFMLVGGRDEVRASLLVTILQRLFVGWAFNPHPLLCLFAACYPYLTPGHVKLAIVESEAS